jgi:uridylate kinase
LIKRLRKKEHQVAVVVGGGVIAREFINAAKKIGLDEKVQDQVAIHVSRIFARFFMEKFQNSGCQSIPSTIEKATDCFNEGKIVVMGGLQPGMTTDAVAALLAENTNADLYIKATDQDGIYDKDPKKYSDAVKLDKLSFDDLSHFLINKKHRAGMNQILDPKAIKILRKARIKTIVINGFNPENTLSAVHGEKIGTLIE